MCKNGYKCSSLCVPNDYRRLFYRDIEICPQKYTTVWDIVNKQKNNFFFTAMQGTKLPILKEMNDI